MKKKIFWLSVGIMVGMWGILVGGGVGDVGGWLASGVEKVYAEEVDGDGGMDDEKDDRMPLYIKAVSPGYTEDGISNVGEMIEIGRNDKSNVPISLAGVAVGYTTSSGTFSTLKEFPENSWMTGDSILLRLDSSPHSELSALTYDKKQIAVDAGITLLHENETLDAVCFHGSKRTMKVTNEKDAAEISCLRAFNSSKPTTIVFNEESLKFEHVEGYTPVYKAESYYEVESEEPDGEEGFGGGGSESGVVSRCKGMEFSEILTYYESAKTEQFIELKNTTDAQILLDGCKVGYKNKTYTLTGVARAGEYFVYRPEGFSLTKNPTNFNEISLVDTDGEVVDTLKYPNGQRKGTSYMFVGYDEKGEELWRVTYAPTPGEANNYQEFKTCEEGKVINEATGNCVKATEVKEKTCETGYFLNVLTGRCNKIVATTAKTCKEGYEINPETGRCRKIKENDGAEYELAAEEGEYEQSSVFVAVTAVGIVLIVGLGYLGWEFRAEIVKLWRKVFR